MDSLTVNDKKNTTQFGRYHVLYHVKKLMQQKKNQYEWDLIQLSFTVHKLRNGH